jgi:hypothetical protein
MAAWSWSFKGNKAAASTAISALTASALTDFDTPVQNLSGNANVVSHLGAAKTAASAALAVLVGNAPNVTVLLRGYFDPNSTAPHPGAAASRVTVDCVEYWN